MRLIIPKLIKAINKPTTSKVRFFLASLTSAHLEDSIIHIIPLKITMVTANTIVILKINFVILTIKGASVLNEPWIRELLYVHHKIFSQKDAVLHAYSASFFCVVISPSETFCPLISHPAPKLTSQPTHSLNISLPTAFFPAQRLIIVSLVNAG